MICLTVAMLFDWPASWVCVCEMDRTVLPVPRTCPELSLPRVHYRYLRNCLVDAFHTRVLEEACAASGVWSRGIRIGCPCMSTEPQIWAIACVCSGVCGMIARSMSRMAFPEHLCLRRFHYLVLVTYLERQDYSVTLAYVGVSS